MSTFLTKIYICSLHILFTHLYLNDTTYLLLLVSNIEKYLLSHTLALNTHNDLRQTQTRNEFLETLFTPFYFK